MPLAQRVPSRARPAPAGARTARLGLALVALLAAGCVSRREKALVYVPEGSLAPRDPADLRPRPLDRRKPRTPPRDDADAGAATALARATEDAWRGGVRAGGPDDAGAPEAGLRTAEAAAGPAPAAGLPPGVAAVLAEARDPTPGPPPPPAHPKVPEGVRLEDLAREVLFSCETRVVAEKATLYVPARYAGEATLSGATVVESGPGRRTATLGVLRLRRLEVRARTVTLVVRTDGDDVSLTARGDVAFRAERPASVIDERGLKTLVVRNDGYTPLR